MSDARPPALDALPGTPSRALHLCGDVLDEHGGEAAWSVLALRADESLDGLFEHQLLLRREPGAQACPPRSLLGRSLDLRIELGLAGAAPTAAPRWLNGVVSQAACLHEQPHGTLYALRLRPQLARARLRGQCRAWRGRSVPEVLRELVAPLGVTLRERLRGPHAPQDYLVQFNQSDWEFFLRLTRQWGLRFWFEHRRGAHDLVLADHDGAALEQPAPAWRALEVGRVGEREDHEKTQGRPKFSRPPRGAGWAQPGPGGAHEKTPGRAHEALQELRLARGPNGEVASAWAWGPVRGVAACHRLRLHDGRLAPAQREFLVLRSRLLLREAQVAAWPWSTASPAELAAACRAAAIDADGFGDAGRRWDFPPPRGRVVDGWELHDELWLRPARGALHARPGSPRPRARGPQSAVVARSGAPAPAAATPQGEVDTDALGRVRARLAWDRAPERPRAGTPEPPGTPSGPAPATTPWIRVAAPWAGCELGWLQVPRVGQEVLLGYLDGELERPLLLGALYRALQRPRWELPRNRVLGGTRSRELPVPGEGPLRERPAGEGESEPVGEGAAAFPVGSQLVLDDTADCLHLQLLCERPYASLALGRIARVEGEAGRRELRGVGGELHTEAQGLLHSVQGMLLGTHGREPHDGAAADAAEALRGLESAARWRGEALEAARGAGMDLEADVQSGTRGPQQAFPRAAPELLLDGADGIALTATRHAQLGAAQDLDLMSGDRLGLHAGADLLALAAAGLRVHVHRIGLRLAAAAGPLHLQACDGPLLAAARDRLSLRSASDLRVRAARGIVLAGGGSFVRLAEGGIDYGSPGSLVQRGAAPRMVGA